MKFPRVRSRSLLSPALIALLLVPMVRAADAIASKPISSHARTQQLIFTPTNLHFGLVAVGRQKSRAVTITNSGYSSIKLLQVTRQGMGFTLNGIDLPLTLAGGESFTFTAVFAPRSLGTSNGSISFSSEVSDVSDVPNPILMLEFDGEGADGDQLIVDPASMDFGTVQLGSSAIQGGTLAAVVVVAASPVTISSAKISNEKFSLSGISFPLTIPAGGNQGFLVTFTPQTNGVTSGTLTFLDGLGNPLVVESLYGVGTVSKGHSVDLSWNASTSQNVIGYNVYRGTRSGGPYTQINPVLDASTVYTDTSVVDRTTYYYVTTAVNSDNQESIYSNEAKAIIPGDQFENAARTQRATFSRKVARTHSMR
jgi:hypothetical protein